MRLQGIFASVTTPFDHRGELYVPKIHFNVSRWNRTALAGYLVAGEAGEGPLLTAEERIRLWEEVAKARSDQKLLLAAAGAESVRGTVELARRAAEIGFQAVVVGTPRYYRREAARAETQALFYRAVADQTKIPVIVENSPLSSGIEMGVETVVRLAEHPNIVAISESSGQEGRIEQLSRAVPRRFQVLAGSETALYPALRQGAAGAIGALAGAAPFFCLSIGEAVRTREYEAAEQMQARATPAALAVTAQYGVPGLKYALDLQGYYGGLPRLPLLPAGPEARRHIEQAFREISS